jgi:hypothetical protein
MIRRFRVLFNTVISMAFVNRSEPGVLSFNPAFAGQQLLPESLFAITQGEHVSFLPRWTLLELTFQNNESIRGALVVGILPIAKADWFSGVNNLRVSLLLNFLKYSD